MPKIDINGFIRDMTAEELAEYTEHLPPPIKDELEERLERIEKVIEKVKSLLGVKD